MEFQYWSFMMSHPAHALLPSESVSEAIDVLTWSYTGMLIPAFFIRLANHSPRVRPSATVAPSFLAPIQSRRMPGTFNATSFFQP
jgi:hypothetical protein